MSRKLTLPVVSFRQTPEEPIFIYALNSDRQPELGEYVDMPVYGNFARVQKVISHSQLHKGHPVIEASSNKKYGLPQLPAKFVEAYNDCPADNPRVTLWLEDVKTVNQ